MKKVSKVFGYLLLALFVLSSITYALLSISRPPEKIVYGMSFSASYSKELGLDWKETYLAILDDLRVRRLRLTAHWPTIENTKDVYDFSELRFQLDEAQKRGARAVVVLGRRTPRWPECHVPHWYDNLSEVEAQARVKNAVQKTVEEFKDHPAVEMWQVENEPFLEVFAPMHCGELNEKLLKEEIELVHSLDPSRKVLVTDSGNLGTWFSPYRLGDAFGTSVYIYLWNPELGPFKSLLPPSFYRVKHALMELLFGEKPSYLIELSIEPWLVTPVVDTPLETQFERMDVEKFNEIIEYARKTHFERQYLWGAEWWYWLSKKGHPEFWEKGRKVFEGNRIEPMVTPFAESEDRNITDNM